MTESRQAALAGVVVFLVLMALMVLAAMAMASPLPPAPPAPTSGVMPGMRAAPDLQVTHLIEHLHRTLDALEDSGSGRLWERTRARSAIHTSSLDLPWVSEEYPEWRYAFLIPVASSRWPVGTIPVCEHPAGGPRSIVQQGVYETP